jgi:NarL family two-component system response regulator LiaR
VVALIPPNDRNPDDGTAFTPDHRPSGGSPAPGGTPMTRPGGEPAAHREPVGHRNGDARLRVTLVNDYELVVRGLHAMLAPYSDRVVVVDDATEEESQRNGTSDVPHTAADIALFDTFAARRDALDRARSMIDAGEVEHIVLYTWDAPPEFVREARDIGVAAVIPKASTAEELVEALERVANGERVGLDDTVKGERSRVDGPELTVREQEVLALLALGLSNAEIAHELFLSVDTIKTHVRRVFSKLGVNNRTQAAMRVVTAQSGLRPLLPPERSSGSPRGNGD